MIFPPSKTNFLGKKIAGRNTKEITTIPVKKKFQTLVDEMML